MSENEERYRVRARRGGFLPKPPSAKTYQDRRVAVEGAPATDQLDVEIDRALAEGKPADLARAFPYVPDTSGRRIDITEPPAEGPLPAAQTTRPKARQSVPEAIARARQERAAQGAAPNRDPQFSPVDEGQLDGMSPRERMEYVQRVAPSYVREYRMQLLHRLLLRGLPLDTIARTMDSPVPTILSMRAQLYKRMRQEAKLVDIYLLAGKTLAFYGEIQAMAMRLASDGKSSPRNRIDALRTAMLSEREKHSFLQTSGFYDHVQFKPRADEEADEALASAQSVLGMLEHIMGGKLDDEDPMGLPDQSADEDDEVVLLWPK